MPLGTRFALKVCMMTHSRPWRHSTQSSQQNRIRVDEQVVRKMLQVNPGLRQGRTTAEIKRTLEAGGSFHARDEAKVDAADATQGVLAAFLAQKSRQLADDLEAIEHRRAALAAQAQQVRNRQREELLSFARLLRPGTLSEGAVKSIRRHGALLTSVGLSINDMIRGLQS